MKTVKVKGKKKKDIKILDFHVLRKDLLGFL